MRYIIVSDTHGSSTGLKQVIHKVGYVDGLVHLGDIGRGEQHLLQELEYPSYIVRGNNDYNSQLPYERIIELDGHRIILTHGHRHNIYYGTEELIKLAKEQDVEAVLYGHLHVPSIEQKENIWLVNPGSLSLPRQPGGKRTYVMMEVDRFNKIHWTLCTLD